MNDSGIETFPVGIFLDLRTLWFRLKDKKIRKKYRPIRSFWRNFKRSWRNHNYWNGFLAEWHYIPADVNHYRCGHGWTRNRALKDLGRHLVEHNLHVREQNRRRGKRL